MQGFIFALAFLIRGLLAVDVTFASGSNCTGTGLYGGKNLTSIACLDLTPYDPAQSAILSNFEPGQTVIFYSDESCSTPTSTTSKELCYTEPDSRIGSIEIQTLNPTSKELALAPTTKLSNYKGLAQSSPYNIDVKYPNGYIGATALVASGAVTVASMAYACKDIATGDPVAILVCVGPAIAWALSNVASYFFRQAGMDFNQRADGARGNFMDVKKRQLMDAANFDLMFDAFNTTEGAQHVGFMTRHTVSGVQTSPAFEFDTPVGRFHWAAFLDTASGDFIHHMRSAEQSLVHEKRDPPYGYDALRYQGGMDMRMCPANQAQWGQASNGYAEDPTANYDFLYDQLTCFFTNNQLASATSFIFDYYSASSSLLGELDMSFDTGSGTNAPSCGNTFATVNQDCILS